MAEPCLTKGTTDKTDVVGSTAATACLCHDNGNFICIIFAGQECIHDLTDNDQRRIAGIVIDIFQSGINRMAVIRR